MSTNEKKAQHTPGPWVVTTGISEHDVVTSTHDVAGLDDDVCEVYGGNDDDVRVRRANARLIAAAPDLLAMLQDLADPESGCKLTAHAMANVRAAITKATGGES